ncbi:MAG: HEPN domain-containing protein [Deltaproteobacteria bacterium]|nr:HEPN domain-containing protein [Deltaproteobacteria bacterium]
MLFEGGRYIHAVFICHLSLEKALKGIYMLRLDEMPPRTHNLTYLSEKAGLVMPDDVYDFIFTLTGISIPARYPDELSIMRKGYSKAKTKALLKQGKEVLKWLKAQSGK